MRRRHTKLNSINGRSWRGHRVGDWRIGNRAGYSPKGAALWHATNAKTGVERVGWIQWRESQHRYVFTRMGPTELIVPERWLGNLRSLRGISGRCSDAGTYSDLGVTVCDRWDSLAQGGGYAGAYRALVNFINDMGIRPAGMSIDRINPFGNYEPENCRWNTPTGQARNKRATYQQ